MSVETIKSDFANEPKVTPEERMPKLYNKSFGPTVDSQEFVQEDLWIYEISNKTIEYISSLNAQERKNTFFLKAVTSRKGPNNYIKVLRLDELVLSEIMEYLEDPKVLLMTTKEDD